MRRRQFLRLVGVGALGAGGYAAYDKGHLEKLPYVGSLLGQEQASLSGKAFGPFNNGFKSIEWINLNVLRIHFQESHEMDGFSIVHSADNDHVDDALYIGEAPRFAGPVDYPLIDKIRKSGTVYPSNRFELVALKGSFGGINLIHDELGSVSFRVPMQIMPRENIQDKS